MLAGRRVAQDAVRRSESFREATLYSHPYAALSYMWIDVAKYVARVLDLAPFQMWEAFLLGPTKTSGSLGYDLQASRDSTEGPPIFRELLGCHLGDKALR